MLRGEQKAAERWVPACVFPGVSQERGAGPGEAAEAAAGQLRSNYPRRSVTGAKPGCLKPATGWPAEAKSRLRNRKGSVGILCSPWGFGWGGVGEVTTRGETTAGEQAPRTLPTPSSESRECRKLRGQNESGASHRDQRRGAGIRRALTQSFPISHVGDTGGRRDPPAPAASTGRRQHRHPKASGTQEFGIAKWDLRPIAPTRAASCGGGPGGHPSIQPGKLGCEPKPSWRARAESV